MRKVNRDGFSSEYRKRHSRNKKPKKSNVFDLRILILRLILIGNVFVLACTVWFSLFLPSLDNLDSLMGKESTVFFDTEGEVIYTVNSEEHRENISFDVIPQTVKDAAIAIEDDKFYSHNGFDLGGLLKGVLSELGYGSPRGGSTITQQFIKNAILSTERTYTRKFKELILAARLERAVSKDEILEMYLNRIPYGGQAYGIEKAAEVFFDKNAQDLNLVESAVLAALPNAPTYFSPFGNNKFSTITKEFSIEELQDRDLEDVNDLNSDEWNYGLIGAWHELVDGSSIYTPGRVDAVLKRMNDLDFITDAEKEKALEDLQTLEFNQNQTKQKAYHFVTYVKSILEEEFGKDLVENGGLKVYTTLNLEFQQKVESYVKEQGEINMQRDVNNAAVIAVEPKTGHIKAMVGSKDFANQEIEGFNNMVLANRQPGSSFKPLVFAAAFERGLAPGHMIFDIPIKIGQDEPKNYDGEFMGPISVRKALGQSRNIPAVKAYYVAGEQDSIISFTEKLGIKSLDRRSDYGWPLSLGTGEMSLLELAQSYTVFANDGKFRENNPVLKVLDANGEVLIDNRFIIDESQLQEVIDPSIAFLVSDILSDTSVGLGERLTLPSRKVAAKTGTSTKRVGDVVYPTNFYTIGWTPDLVTVAWAGNTDGSVGNLSASGYSQAGPIWQKTMLEYHKDLPVTNFSAPKNVTKETFSLYSGKIPNETTPNNLIGSDYFIEDFKPSSEDDIFYEAEVDVRNLMVANKYCPDTYVQKVKFLDNLKMETFSSEILATYKPNLLVDRQNEIRDWFLSLTEEESKGLRLGDGIAIGSPILEPSDLCKKEYAEMELSIEAIGLKDGYFISKGNNNISVEYNAEAGAKRVEYFINDDFRYKSTLAPFKGIVRVTEGNNTPIKLTVKVFDNNDYVAEKNYNLIVGDSSKNPKDEKKSVDLSDLKLPGIKTSNPDGLANELKFDASKLSD